MPTLDELGRSLLSQIYSALTGGDQHVPPAADNFVSWCTPGIAFEPKDFDFCVKGLGGGANAEEEKTLLQQAFNFAELVDFVPDPLGIYNDDPRQTIHRTSGARLTEMYSQILNASLVVSSELPADQKAKLDKFRNLLRTTKKVKNIVTDEETEVTQDGPVLQAYNDKMSAYIDAALAYNAKRIAAQSATGVDGKAAVMDWASNAGLYRLKVKAAMDAWVSGGYRNEVDLMNAYIDQTTRRDMHLWKQHLLEYYDEAKLSALGPGQAFHYTSVVPGTFASAKGWTEYKFSHQSVDTTQHSSYNAWSVGGGVSFGLFSASANASGTNEKMSATQNLSSYGVSFELTQVAISRPWYFPEFFSNRGWTLRKGEGWLLDGMPSNGVRPKPDGICIGYPMLAVFARNIVIQSSEFSSAYSSAKSTFSAGGSIGWGPFSLSSSYKRGDSTTTFHSKADQGSVSVPGMQLIAFVNRLIPKAPNPLPELKPEAFEK